MRVDAVEIGGFDPITRFTVNGVDLDPSTLLAPSRLVYDDFGHELRLAIRGPMTEMSGEDFNTDDHSVRQVDVRGLTASWTTADGVTHRLHEDGSLTHSFE